jgi:hypothetical protein
VEWAEGTPVPWRISLLTSNVKKDESTIPAVIGGGGRISRCLASVQFLRNSTQVVAEGYCQHPTGVFRVPILFRDWFYLACGRKRVQEIASAPNNILSLDAALNVVSRHFIPLLKSSGVNLPRYQWITLSERSKYTTHIISCRFAEASPVAWADASQRCETRSSMHSMMYWR